MSVKEIFRTAVHGETKDERRQAFRELREIATRGTGPEANEARFALEHSAEYSKRMEAT